MAQDLVKEHEQLTEYEAAMLNNLDTGRNFYFIKI